MPSLASASYATRRGLTRPFARKTAQHRRLGQKLSMGLTPAQAAWLEGLAPQAVETLLTEPDFSALVQGYKALDAMPEEEQRRILTQLARHLLMEAAALGDIRVACFIPGPTHEISAINVQGVVSKGRVTRQAGRIHRRLKN